ncbi:MAG: beta-class carbonic anhydrase [Rubrobacteraceae bacterium]
MAVFDEFSEANRQYAAAFDSADLSPPPARQVAVVTCMDARLDPRQFLGMDLGDAHVIRNAGGRVSQDAIRSLVISQQLLGTNEVVVIQHTDCGMMTFENKDLADKIQQDLGVDVSDHDFLTFPELDQCVRDDVETLRDSALIPDDVTLIGAVYDVASGEVREVVRG